MVISFKINPMEVLFLITSTGIYIGDTRAFSSDNNPWVESAGTGSVDGKLTTEVKRYQSVNLHF